VASDAEARAALEEHAATLAQEVLATTLGFGGLAEASFSLEAELGAGSLTIALRRAV